MLTNNQCCAIISTSSRETEVTVKLAINTDGASRGNPGAAAWAFVAVGENSGVRITRSGLLGSKTNNFAEYAALIEALKFAAALQAKEVFVHSDSKLVVEQMAGRWAVKHADIRPLWAEAAELAEQFPFFHITHIRREFNTEADAECNRILDLGVEVHA
jgi:ribonuclease HI